MSLRAAGVLLAVLTCSIAVPRHAAAADEEGPKDAPVQLTLTLPPAQPVLTPVNDDSRAIRALRWSLVGTQALDLHSTLQATGAGAREENPVARPFTSSTPLFIALKGASTWLVMRSTNGLAKRNRKAAFWVLAAANTAFATVAVRNYRVAAAR